MYRLLVIGSRHELAGTAKPDTLELQVDYLRSLGLHVHLIYDPDQSEIEKCVASRSYNAAYATTMYSFEEDEAGGSRARPFNILRLFMHLDQPFIGSEIFTQLIVSDKTLCAQKTGIAPQGTLITRSMFESDTWESALSAIPEDAFPVIIKPNNLSCSLGLSSKSVSYRRSTIRSRLISLFDRFSYLTEVRVERYIEKAREYTVAVLGNGPATVFGATAITTKHSSRSFNDEYQKKMEASDRARRYKLVASPTRSAHLIFHARQACKVLGIRDFARLDFLFDSRAYLIDVNALPVLGNAFSWEWQQAYGLGLEQLIALPLVAFHYRQTASGIPDPLPDRIAELVPPGIRRVLENSPPVIKVPESTPPNRHCARTESYSMPDRISAETEVIRFLGALVELLKPDLIVETGTWKGATSVSMAQALSRNGRGRLVTIEKDAKLCLSARSQLSGLPVEVVCSDSMHYVPNQKIDLLFLDSHRATRGREFAYFREYLTPSTLIVWHDAAPEHREVFHAIENLYDEGVIDRLLLPTPRGLTLSMLRDWGQA